MARRVVLNSGGLKVGPSGADAATSSNLLFDGTSAPYNGVYMKGHTTTSGWTQTTTNISASGTSGKQYERTITIPFGKTFASPPRTYCMVIDPSNSSATQNYAWYTLNEAVGGSLAGVSITLYTAVSTTGLTLTIYEDAYGTSANATNEAIIAVDVAFIIFTT